MKPGTTDDKGKDATANMGNSDILDLIRNSVDLFGTDDGHLSCWGSYKQSVGSEGTMECKDATATNCYHVPVEWAITSADIEDFDWPKSKNGEGSSSHPEASGEYG